MDGGRALDLDVPRLGERLLLHLQPGHSATLDKHLNYTVTTFQQRQPS